MRVPLAAGLRGCGDRANVETEAIKTQCRSAFQEQLTLCKIDARDGGDHQGDSSLVGESAQVDVHLIKAVTAGDQTWDHSRVERGAALAHEDDEPVGSFLGAHRPATQQQGMAVATSSQHQNTHGSLA